MSKPDKNDTKWVEPVFLQIPVGESPDIEMRLMSALIEVLDHPYFEARIPSVERCGMYARCSDHLAKKFRPEATE